MRSKKELDQTVDSILETLKHFPGFIKSTDAVASDLNKRVTNIEQILKELISIFQSTLEREKNNDR